MTEMNTFEAMINGEPEKRVGEQVGSYRLIGWLGRGTFADVYLGEHIYLGTQSAIKMLHVHLPEKAVEDFLNEARIIARLDHPNIVRVFDYGVENGTPFLVMAYAPNGSLRQCFPEKMCVSLEQIVPLVQQVASALDYAHQQKLIHRDVKPENMLLGPQNQVLLSDFGVVLIAQDAHSQAANAMVGTALYMAPEMVEGKVHFASDQYALGIVTYQWLCGDYPFTGSYFQVGTQHMLVPPPSLCEKVPDLPPSVEHVVFKALAKDRAQRYENVTAFANALQDACKNASSTAINSLTPQLSSLSLETLLIPAETSILPEEIKPTQPSPPPGNIWRTLLALLIVVAVIAASVHLWYDIASSRVSTHSTAPTEIKYNPALIVKGRATVMVIPSVTANVTSTGTVSRGTLETPSISDAKGTLTPVPLPTPTPTLPASYEAESLENTLAGGATVLQCSSCSGGDRVGYIGFDGNTHTTGILQFNNIYKNINGNYRLTMYYLIAGVDSLTGYMSVNGGPGISFTVPRTASVDIVGTFNIIISLKAGNNTIAFSNPSVQAPDLDRIVV